MSVAKRVSQTSLNWVKISEKLTSGHAADLTKLKGQNSTYTAVVDQLPADLPKVDFAALKKALPTHSATIDALQKQYEAIKIPYGEVPKEYLQEVDQWVQYNNARMKLHQLKVDDGIEQAKKVEAKWATAPPVEHFDRQHFAEYFPQHFYDLRYQERIPDPCSIGLNETDAFQKRFSDYKVLVRPDKVDDH